MNDMSVADVIVGVKLLRNQNKLVLTQSHNIEKILKKLIILIALLQ